MVLDVKFKLKVWYAEYDVLGNCNMVYTVVESGANFITASSVFGLTLSCVFNLCNEFVILNSNILYM